MQFEILRKIDVQSSARLRQHNSCVGVMTNRKRKRAHFAPERTDNRPFWWNDHVEALSQQLRESPDSLDLSRLQPRECAIKHITRTTSNKKIATHGHMRLLRVRIKPTTQQRAQFHKWFGIYRMVFNKTVDRLNHGVAGTQYDHRKFVLGLSGLCSDNESSPCDLRQAASKAASSAFAATRLSLKAKGKDPNTAHVGHALKKDRMQQFKITAHNKKACAIHDGHVNFWPTTGIGHVKIKKQLDVAKLMSHYPSCHVSREVIVHYERPDMYYLLVPVEIPRPDAKPVQLVMATDPGVRTFHTTFDSNGHYESELEGALGRIRHRCLKAERLQRCVATYRSHVWDKINYSAEGTFCENKNLWRNKRKRMKRELGFLRIKIANIKRDMHAKLVSAWCNKYTDMIVPKFDVSKMVKNDDRVISKDSAKDMLNWGHYKFRMRLISKAAEMGVRVHELSEHYTTKTCGKCGNMREMGDLKVYECTASGCKHRAGRDHNAAFNIFIKNIGTALVPKHPLGLHVERGSIVQ